MTREVRILCGVPGVGKSTWAVEEVKRLKEDGWHPVVISRDEVRFAFLDANNSNDYFAYEDEVFSEFIREINEAIELGFDYVFVDATHINYRSRIKTLRRLRLDAQTTVVFDVFDEPLPVALYRNAQREGRARVPVSAIKNMHNSFTVPDEDELVRMIRELRLRNAFEVRRH